MRYDIEARNNENFAQAALREAEETMKGELVRQDLRTERGREAKAMVESIAEAKLRVTNYMKKYYRR